MAIRPRVSRKPASFHSTSAMSASDGSAFRLPSPTHVSKAPGAKAISRQSAQMAQRSGVSPGQSARRTAAFRSTAVTAGPIATSAGVDAKQKPARSSAIDSALVGSNDLVVYKQRRTYPKSMAVEFAPSETQPRPCYSASMRTPNGIVACGEAPLSGLSGPSSSPNRYHLPASCPACGSTRPPCAERRQRGAVRLPMRRASQRWRSSVRGAPR